MSACVSEVFASLAHAVDHLDGARRDVGPPPSERGVERESDQDSRGQRAVDRMQQRWPNARLVQLPVHASSLNQIEIYFSIVQRKVLTPNDFTDLTEVETRLLGFERRYEQTATPFEWRFTRSDLAKLLERLADKPDYQAAA